MDANTVWIVMKEEYEINHWFTFIKSIHRNKFLADLEVTRINNELDDYERFDHPAWHEEHQIQD